MNVKRNYGLVFKATELTLPEEFSLLPCEFSEKLFFRTPPDEFQRAYTCRKSIPEILE